MERKRRFGVLNCENSKKWVGLENLFIEPLKDDGEEWVTFHVFNKELPDIEHEQWNGFVIPGSHHAAYGILRPSFETTDVH
jgi:hypothetical protein